MTKGAGGAWARAVVVLVAVSLTAMCAALSACTSPSAPQPSTPSQSAGQSQPGQSQAGEPQLVETLQLSLQIPWSVVFLQDGTALISERDSGLVKAVRNGRATVVGQVPGVVPGGEGGLLGLALSPTFSTDRLLYTYFTAAEDNRIARTPLVGGSAGGLTLGSTQVIFTGIPKASTHNGGRIRFGPDGFLYAGTGDAQHRDQPQDPTALGGKILRITAEGKPAPGNPFGDNPVYSLGHRNVQGLAWDADGSSGPASSDPMSTTNSTSSGQAATTAGRP